jgi:hypothetical protein
VPFVVTRVIQLALEEAVHEQEETVETLKEPALLELAERTSLDGENVMGQFPLCVTVKV